jgi:hypothetical protein
MIIAASFLSMEMYLSVHAQLCKGAPQSHASIQWSEGSRVISPDHAWRIIVKPVLGGDENASPVILESCSTGATKQILTLERRAEIIWNLKGDGLAIVNQPTADAYILTVLDPSQAASGQYFETGLELNNRIRNRIEKEVGEHRHLDFYLPRIVEWRERGLVIGVGGTSSPEAGGELREYCYGIILAKDLQITKFMSEHELKVTFGKGCLTSP